MVEREAGREHEAPQRRGLEVEVERERETLPPKSTENDGCSGSTIFLPR